MATIQTIQNNGDLSCLKAVVCSATGTITYLKNGKRENMMKIGVRDQTGVAPVLVFVEKMFPLLTKAAQSHHTIKLSNYRYTPQQKTIVVNSNTTCSVIMKSCKLTPQEIEEGKKAMYAEVIPLKEAIRSPVKTRISTSGKIAKIYQTESKSKRILLKEQEFEALVTLWEPHNSVAMEVGQTLQLYDAKVSGYQGGSIDTSSGTAIEVISSPPEIKVLTGEVVGIGHEHGSAVIEFIKEDEEEETTISVTDSVFVDLESAPLPLSAFLTITNGIVTEFEI